MKKLYALFMILPLGICSGIYPFLPSQIPAHYNALNQVDRYGSKNEIFILPVVVILFGMFMLAMSKVAKKQERSKEKSNDERICLYVGLLSLILFNVICCFFLYCDFNQIVNLNSLKIDLMQISFGFIGLMFILIGNQMTKLRRNVIIGLRTPWSMKNDDVWKKCQRFAGIGMIVVGILLIISSFCLKGTVNLCMSMGLILIDAFVDIVYSYRVSRREA